MYTKYYIFYKDPQHSRMYYPKQNGWLCREEQNKRQNQG